MPGDLVKIHSLGNSLAVQRLRLALPLQGVRVRSLVGELRSHMPHSTAKTQKINKQTKSHSDSADLECSLRLCTFVISSQTMLILLVCGHTLSIKDLNQ